jgi:cbb3-type cytochrome oxidase subunit 3
MADFNLLHLVGFVVFAGVIYYAYKKFGKDK